MFNEKERVHLKRRVPLSFKCSDYFQSPFHFINDEGYISFLNSSRGNGLFITLVNLLKWSYIDALVCLGTLKKYPSAGYKISIRSYFHSEAKKIIQVNNTVSVWQTLLKLDRKKHPILSVVPKFSEYSDWVTIVRCFPHWSIAISNLSRYLLDFLRSFFGMVFEFEIC